MPKLAVAPKSYTTRWDTIQPIRNLDVIALQIDILSITIAVMGVVLAIIGFLGYQTIRAAAEAKADEVATEVASRAMALHMPNVPGTSAGTQAPVEPGEVTLLTTEEGE